jgi:putative hemolysin
METLWFEVLGMLFMIFLVGFFSAAEVAVLSTRKSRMQELAEGGNRKAAIVLSFQQDPEHFLATIHVGVVFTLIIASGLGGSIGVEHLTPALRESAIPWVREASPWLALAIIAVTIGFLVVVFGELVPKSLALRSAESIAMRLASPMVVFRSLFRYPAQLLAFASNVVLRPFKDRTSFTESRISEEEFKLMLDEGTKSGVIDKTEQRLIKSIFEFTETTAKEVMVPRPDVVALNVNMSRERLVKVVVEEGYSRMPVYRDTIDHIIGIVYTKDLLSLLEFGSAIILQDILRTPYFIPDSMKISTLMQELQQRKIHMAVIADEFGGTEGIVTMEDILEEIVGEIHDEYDEELRDIEQAADGSYVINAHVSISDFNERFQGALPESEGYETLGGFLCKQAGRIPDVNEELTYGRWQFSIVRKSLRRIRVLKVKSRHAE